MEQRVHPVRKQHIVSRGHSDSPLDRRARNKGRTNEFSHGVYGDAFRITVRRSASAELRVVVGRSVAKRAVVRNTLRRQVREWFRQRRIAPPRVTITVYVLPPILQYARRERYQLLARHAAAISRGSVRARPHRRLPTGSLA